MRNWREVNGGPGREVLVLQDERLRRLVKYAYDNVPYYHKIFEQRALKPDDIESSRDLVKLPILTKRLIRDNFSDLVARGFPKRELITCYTGGSTGEPLRFYGARKDIHGWGCAAGLRAYGWVGYEVGAKCALLCEKSPYESTTARFSRITRHFLERIVLFDALEISEEKLPLFAKRLEGFQGGFIKGYPTAIYLLARFIEREGQPKIRPKAIIAVGEELSDFQRELFSKVFECDVYVYYGSVEVQAIASECSQHSGYHISAENIVVEIVDDEGKPVPAEGEGRILLTSLHSYAMPFIRYEIGDIGMISDRACPCGRGLPLLAAIQGRTADVIFTRSGKAIPGVTLPFRVFVFLGVEEFQIVQETYEKVVIKVVLGREYPRDNLDEVVRKIVGQFRPALGEDVEIVTEFVDQIPSTRRGKRRFVISNVPERF